MQIKDFSSVFVIAVCYLGANAVPYRQYVQEPGFMTRNPATANPPRYNERPLPTSMPNILADKLYSQTPITKPSTKSEENLNKNINFNFVQAKRRPSGLDSLYKSLSFDEKEFADEEEVIDPFSELIKDVKKYMVDSKTSEDLKKMCEPNVFGSNMKKDQTPWMKNSQLPLTNIFDIGSPKVKKQSSVHDGTQMTLCWIETLTIKEDHSLKPPQRLVLRDYTVRFENSASILLKDLDCTRLRGEITPGNKELICDTDINQMIVDDVKRSVPKNTTFHNRIENIINFQQRNIKCVSGGIVTKTEFEWPNNNENPKRRVEIKVAPKVRDITEEFCDRSSFSWNKDDGTYGEGFLNIPTVPNGPKYPDATNAPINQFYKSLKHSHFSEEAFSFDSSDETCESCDQTSETDVPLSFLGTRKPVHPPKSIPIPTKPKPTKKRTPTLSSKARSTTSKTKIDISVAAPKRITTKTPPRTTTTPKPSKLIEKKTQSVKNVTSSSKIASNKVVIKIYPPEGKKDSTTTKSTRISTSTPRAKNPFKLYDEVSKPKNVPTKPPMNQGRNKTCAGGKKCNGESCEGCSYESLESGSCGECDSEEDASKAGLTTLFKSARTPTTTKIAIKTKKPKNVSHKLALKIKIVLEHIDEHDEREKLLSLEKHLVMDEKPKEHGNVSLIWHLRSLNKSVNMQTLKEIFKDTKLRNLTEVFSRLTEFPETKPAVGIVVGSNSGRTNSTKKQGTSVKIKNRTKRATIQYNDPVKLMADVASKTKDTLEFLVKGLDQALSTLRSLKRDKRSAKSEKLVAIRNLEHPVKGEEVNRWSDERFFNAANGGRVRNLLEFKIIKDPSEDLRIPSGS